MTDESRTVEHTQRADRSNRQRAIDTYSETRERVSGTLGEAPLIALASGMAAGALIAALLPRTDAEARAIGPAARRVKSSARAAFTAAKDTGSERLGDLGLGRDRAEDTIRSFFKDVTDAAKASGQAALDASRGKG